ncbi:MAG TPA: hypothetical protein VGC79_19050 [Polyangiaceae bacterium]
MTQNAEKEWNKLTRSDGYKIVHDDERAGWFIVTPNHERLSINGIVYCENPSIAKTMLRALEAGPLGRDELPSDPSTGEISLDGFTQGCDIQAEINALQKRHNFNPFLGARQLHSGQREDYQALAAAVSLAKTSGVTGIVIPYSALGHIDDPALTRLVPIEDARISPLRGPQGPRPPRAGTFAATKATADRIAAANPEVPHANILWAAKRLAGSTDAEILAAAKTR